MIFNLYLARFRGPYKKKAKKLGLSLEQTLRSRKVSDYGLRLKEKQKAKYIFGVLERQFRKYFENSSKNKENTGFLLMQTLERRLDNVVYRLGFTKSRMHARQLVNHGHVLVDNKSVNIPSFQVKPEETITLSKKVLENPHVLEALAQKEETASSWLTRDGVVGKILRPPQREEMEQSIDEKLIIEYYSR